MNDEADIASIMEEPPGGHNFGFKDGIALDAVRAETHQLLAENGLSQAYRSDIGARAHRGVLHPDEYVDHDAVLREVEAEFGFTQADVETVYSTKTLTKTQRQLRAEIDARLLALSRSGATMSEFAKVMGINQRTMERALARARAEDAHDAFS